MSSQQQNVHINGEPKTVTAQTIKQLITELNLKREHLAIAVNNSVIPSAEHDMQPIKSGDQIEIIQPVCGG